MNVDAALFWLIQINAVVWFISLGVFLGPESSIGPSMLLIFGLFVSALLEFFILRKNRKN